MDQSKDQFYTQHRRYVLGIPHDDGANARSLACPAYLRQKRVDSEAQSFPTCASALSHGRYLTKVNLPATYVVTGKVS